MTQKAARDNTGPDAAARPAIALETLMPGLHASAPQQLPFAPTLDIRAFLLEREQGNLLVYSVSDFDGAAPEVKRVGGVQRQYLNHWHESMFAAAKAGAPVFVHAADREESEKKLRVAETFSGRHMVGDDFEAIPIPGHTPGATAYLWENGGDRFLFTGDSIYLSEGEWVAAVLESSDREAYLASLEALRELDFNLLVPWAATGTGPCLVRTDRADARRRIGAIIERVRRGGDR